MPELNLVDLAKKLAEDTKKGINDGTLLTVAGVKLHVDKLIEEAGLGTTGIAGLPAALKALVEQAIPASSVFNANRAADANVDVLSKGFVALGKERQKEVHLELIIGIAPRCEDSIIAKNLNVDVSMVVAARKRLNDATQKTISVATGATGGFAIPDEFKAEVQRKLVYSSPLRSNLMNFSGVGLKGSMPRETGSVTVYYTGETQALTSSDPALGSFVWGLNKRTMLGKLSGDIMRFSPVNFVTLLSTMFAEQSRVKDDMVFFSGTGSNQPRGFSTATTGMNTVAQAGAALDYDDFVNLKHKLPVQYRLDGCFFAMNNDTLAKVAKLRDNQGRPLFLDSGLAGIGGPNIPAQTIGFILGIPVVELNSILNTYGSGNKSQVWLLNKRCYAVMEGPTQEFETSNVANDAFTSDLVYARGISYDDGNVLIAEAAAYLSGVI